MGLDNVIGRIEKEGDEEAGRIDLETHTQANEIIDTSRKIATTLSEKRKKDTLRQVEGIYIQERSSAELEAKKILLNAQKEILDYTYHECLTALSSVPQDRGLIQIIAKAKREMPEAVYIYSNKNDEQTVRGVSGFIYAGNIDCAGGVVVENKDRTLRIDYRYETITSVIWERNMKEIAMRLFK